MNLLLIGEHGNALAGRNEITSGSQEPQRLGRALGTMAGRASAPEVLKQIPTSDSFSNIEVSRVDGPEATEIRQLTFRANVVGSPAATIKCQIDPSRGYITPLIQELDSKEICNANGPAVSISKLTVQYCGFPSYVCSKKQIRPECMLDLGRNVMNFLKRASK